MEISKENLLKAISHIDNNPNLVKGRSSSTYDLVYEGKKYPPILVLSEANKMNGGKELFLTDFDNKIDIPFKILKDNGFIIENKKNAINVWVEKTITKNRIDRLEGDRALGRALWSPQRDKGGADIYKNMRNVKAGDIILHLVDNKMISGVSKVKNDTIETIGTEGTDWVGPAYLVELEGYQKLIRPIERKEILNDNNKLLLNSIAKSSEVFFNKKLDLRQGAYLTPCPYELLGLINKIYNDSFSVNLPYVDFIENKMITMQNLNFNFKTFHKATYDSGLIFSEKLVARFVASLFTKPFVLCSGLSGSGKTKLAQAFVHWISENDKQYKIIPVGADWTNREPLLGYPNGLDPKSYVTPDSGALQLILEATKEENQSKPFFMILDEMNLSHVERYFADFLSIMESKEKLKLYSGEKRYSQYANENEFDEDYFIPHEIEWPNNLFIIGTVNIDETTYMFSPKVLDRANVIEFRITPNEMKKFFKDRRELIMKELFLDKDKSKGGAGQSMGENFFKLAADKTIIKIPEIEGDDNVLNNFFTELQIVGAEFGYRSATEIELLVTKLGIEGFSDDEGKPFDNTTKIDIAIMQKLLPKLHGSRNKLTKVLSILGGFCLEEDSEKIKEYYLDKFLNNSLREEEISKDPNIKYPLSFDKICRMYKNAIENGFASYAEA